MEEYNTGQRKSAKRIIIKMMSKRTLSSRSSSAALNYPRTDYTEIENIFHKKKKPARYDLSPSTIYGPLIKTCNGYTRIVYLC
jgi:hypothetical protein